MSKEVFSSGLDFRGELAARILHSEALSTQDKPWSYNWI